MGFCCDFCCVRPCIIKAKFAMLSEYMMVVATDKNCYSGDDEFMHELGNSPHKYAQRN